MTTRKFYKTEVVVTVLSEEPLNPNLDLSTLHFAITQGECSGVTEIKEPTEINGQEAATALLEQGSDPEFFQIDKNGDDLGQTTNPIKESYPDGKCPDCGETIADDVVDGEECKNCGHVFSAEKENDD